jgi:molybdopterin converting factor small subunit
LWVVKSGEQSSQVDLALSEGTTAATLLTSLTRQRNVVVVINDRVVSDLVTPLVDGDNILLLAPISGG